jgi:hypothetical protein
MAPVVSMEEWTRVTGRPHPFEQLRVFFGVKRPPSPNEAIDACEHNQTGRTGTGARAITVSSQSERWVHNTLT